MKKLTIILLLLPFLSNAQEKGMHFEHGVTWAAIQAKAKAEKKYIFMDCYTTWCGPCRYMTSTIFPQEKAGAFMNEKFINVKVQLDTTATDSEEVKSWYKDGHDIMVNYKIQAFPTYLFFDPNGNVVHRSVGAGPAEMFLAKAANALNPETQYYTLLKQYESGTKDSASLRKMALAAQDAYDMENAKKIADAYLATQSDLFTKTNLEFVRNFTQTSSDKGFDLLLNNGSRVNEILGKGAAEEILLPIIMQEEIFRKSPGEPGENPDWADITAGITKKYPSLAAEAIAKAKVMWYQSVRDWNNYQTAIVAYMNKYGTNVSPNELNNYAWTVFENCNDMACVEKALEWSKRSFKENNEPMFIDTFANLLYKLGKKDEAVTWEEKALQLAPANDKKTYEETLDKMKKGEKTWN